ncbi:MAG: MFS transporter [Candidatus Kariarchaeaceae archaeon]
MTDSKEVSMWFVPIIALGFASTQLSWALFNIAVPVILDETYGLPLFTIGVIMTWDNILAFFLQPIVGSYSDRTRTRFGRRIPFIIPGVLLSAFFFILLPLSKTTALFIFLANIVVFNLCMTIYRSPTVSLLPDLVQSKDRSMGNGIVNLMGGAFAGISLFVGGALLEDGRTFTAFAFVSIGMILSMVVLVSVIREPNEYVIEEKNDISIFTVLKDEIHRIRTIEDKSLLFLLLAILTWFMAWNAIEAFYSTYVWKTFLPEKTGEKAAGEAGGVLFVFPVVFVLSTLVAGIFGGKFGRIKTMKSGLFFMGSSLVIAAFIQEDSVFNIGIGWKTSFAIIFIISAIGWGLVNVNSIVVVWEHSIDNGTGTGMYYAFASAAAILGPTISGLLMGIIHIKMLFPFSIFFIVVSFFMLRRVHTGEVGDRENIEL